MIIQIYEIQTLREAQTMVELGVDHVGSVLLSEHSWQDEVLKSAVQLVQSSCRKSSIIPLFGQVDIISQAVEFYRPDILHFCETLPIGSEHGKALDTILHRQQVIRHRYPEVEIMRSIPMGRTGRADVVNSLALAELFEPWSDWFLTDTLLSPKEMPSDQDQPVDGFVGITGKTCDWEIARQLVQKSTIPVILAGGIGPDNVYDGISVVRPAGVDSCTLTNAVDSQGNARRFQKDPQRVSAMIQNARNGAGRI